MKAKNKIIKSISAFLIVSILLPAVFSFKPRQAEAQLGVPVNDFIAQTSLGTIVASSGTTAVKETLSWGQKLLEGALKLVAKRILAQMTLAMINWINSGFHGSPLFIENPESFFKDIAKSQVRLLVDMIGYDTFRFPFGPQTALNVISSYKSQLATNAQYSLSKVINDPDLLVRYRNDFNFGGWNGFLINTQYPQNNYLGFNLLIQQNLASRLEGTLQAPAQKVQSLLQQGMGFLSPQTCPSNPNYNNGTNEFLKPSFKPSPGPANESEEAYLERYRIERESWYDPHGSNFCPGGLVSTTPGSVAANQIFNALDTPRESTTLAGALGNSVVDSVAAIFDALLNKLLSDGLSALSGTITGTPPEDNWSYNGQTLSGGTTTSVTGGGLNTPSAVSVRVGQTTSTAISGGTQGYFITSAPNPGVAEINISSSGSSGYVITVTGKGSGTFDATISDSGTSCRKLNAALNDGTAITVAGPCTATVRITVNPIGVLAINPSGIIPGAIPPLPTISAVVNETTTVNISGGDGNYSIQPGAGATQAVAIVGLAGDSLIVSGTGPGRTFVTIKDSSTPVKTLQITIIVTVTATSSMVIPQNIKVVVGGSKTVGPITNGVGPYFVTVANSNVASVTVDSISGILSIQGKAVGETQVNISDSSIPGTKSGSTNVAVEAIGTCRYTSTRIGNSRNDTTVPNITQTECFAFPTNYPQDRSWTRNP